MSTFSVAAIAFYALATSQICLLRSQRARFCDRRTFITLTVLAAMAHASALYGLLVAPMGINLGFFNAAALISWVLVILLLAALTSKPLDSLAVVLLPLAAVCLLFAAYFPSHRILSSATKLGVQAHILTSLLAYSLFTLAALQAVFLAVQEYQIRNRHPGLIMRVLPPLQVMEELLLQMLTGGFILLSLGLISGAMFLENILAQHLVHKTVLSVLAWLVFAIVLWGRHRYGWRGRMLIHWTLAGFITLMLAYFGSKLVLELILHK